MTGWLRQAWVVVRVRFGGPRPAPGPHIPDTVPAAWVAAVEEWRDIDEAVHAVLHHHDLNAQWGEVSSYRKAGHEDMAVAAARALMYGATAKAVLDQLVTAYPELARIKGDLT